MSDWLCDDGTYPPAQDAASLCQGWAPIAQGKPSDRWEFHASTGVASGVSRQSLFCI